MDRFVFPPWVNKFSVMAIVGALGGAAYAGGLLFYATWPTVMQRGYQPEQPVPFSHKLHAGELKMDCRYCHNTVDQAAHAAVPPTNTCANCHTGLNPDGTFSRTAIHTKSVKLQPVRDSLSTGDPIEWNRVHDLADYVYFNHSAHINKGVSCVSCHGRVDKMEVVYQHESLSMSWCLDCHRNPESHIRPQRYITKLDWDPSMAEGAEREEIDQLIQNVHPSTSCSTCHR